MRNPARSNPLLLRSMIRSNQTREILERKLTNLLWLLVKIAAREIFSSYSHRLGVAHAQNKPSTQIKV